MSDREIRETASESADGLGEFIDRLADSIAGMMYQKAAETKQSNIKREEKIS
jgi:hypothetical protein